ncbi:MAG: hypothetical protein KJ923_02760, partial [Candidatus Omnitrophica bacterium]|nr:hypothetical protein [Candidatus Omnitrophota bacterium]
WKRATDALEGALREKELEYDINVGEGAFYGPKIDIKLKDALKRSWQCATIQCDFSIPKRFALTYVDSHGKENQPIMIHRVLLGSLERFIGALIEHYNGELPLWLAPTQVLIIPIHPVRGKVPQVTDGCLRQPASNGVKDTLQEYALKVKEELANNALRVEIDNRKETLDKRIRNAELNKIPYCLIVGEREAQAGKVSVRKKGKGDTGAVGLDEFITKIKEEILNKVC